MKLQISDFWIIIFITKMLLTAFSASLVCFSVVIWLGDLNYRLFITDAADVKQFIVQGDLKKLQEYDQVRNCYLAQCFLWKWHKSHYCFGCLLTFKNRDSSSFFIFLLLGTGKCLPHCFLPSLVILTFSEQAWKKLKMSTHWPLLDAHSLINANI